MSRGPVPDKPSDRPTVPYVAEILRAYYKLPGRSNGGVVHIIIEDGNITQGYADSCLKYAVDWNAEYGNGQHLVSDIEVAKLLTRMTNTQRAVLASMSFYPKERDGQD